MITIPLVVITCFISYLAWTRPGLLERLSHHPYSESGQGQYYRMLSAGFVHGSWGHLGINMFVLWQFGKVVEIYFGQMFGDSMSPVYYVLFYLSAIVIANLGTYYKHKAEPGFSSVGASGVTTAMVFIYAFFDPWQMFLFPPVPAVLFAVLYIGYSTWASSNSGDKIDHLAHLYGGIYGILFLILTFPDSIAVFTRRFIEGWPF